MISRLFAGAAALALITCAACSGSSGSGSGTPETPPPSGPPDLGVVVERASLPCVARPSPGTGVDTLSQVTRDVCLVGPTIEAEHVASTTRRLAHPFSATEVAQLLGAGDPTPTVRRYAWGVLEHELEAFLGDPRSVPLLYGVEVRTGTSTLDLATAAFAPTVPAAGTPAFTTRCGDVVALRQELGAQAFLLYRFSFRTEAARGIFERRVGVDVPLWELGPRLAAVEPELAGSFSVETWVSQYGGDVFALTAVARGADRAAAFVAYVSDEGPGGLVAQARAHPGALGYGFEPWSAVTTAAAAIRRAPPEVTQAQDFLALAIQRRLEVRDRIATLVALGVTGLADEASTVRADLLILQRALERCYSLAAADEHAGIVACTDSATSAALAAAGYVGTPLLSDL